MTPMTTVTTMCMTDGELLATLEDRQARVEEIHEWGDMEGLGGLLAETRRELGLLARECEKRGTRG